MADTKLRNVELPERALGPALDSDACGPLVRREFWTGFKWYMEANSNVNCARVTTDGWMWHNTDLTMGNMLSFLRARLGDMGVKYTLNDTNAETVFGFISRHGEQVEGNFQHPLEWRGGGEDGSGIIEVRRPIGSFDKQDWPGHYAWLQRQLETFRQSMLPLVGRVPPKSEINSWTEALLLREMEMWNPSCLQPARRLLEWSTPPGSTAAWGRGHTGSFAVSVQRMGVTYQPICVRADGTFSLLFTQLKRTPLFEGRDNRLVLLEKFNGIPGIRLSTSVVDSRPSLPLAMMADPKVFDGFIDLLDWFKDCVRAGEIS